ncbi:MAG: DUF4350 domain-containing protein [Akkermansiaceae bacterium]
MRWLMLIGLLFLTGCDPKEDRRKVGEIPLGYTGKARINPYLAAETYLDQQGWDAESSRTWSNYDYETQVIIMPGSFLQTRGMGIRVLEWVANGGNLVLTVEGGEPERNDFTDSSSGMGAPEEGEYTGLDHVFEELGVSSGDYSYQVMDDDSEREGHLARPWETTQIREEWGGHRLEFEGEVGLEIENGWDWIPNADGSSRMIGTTYGAGEVIVLAHARPFRNPYLARADHAEFLNHLAKEYGGNGRIVFLYGSSDSFFGLIWKEGRMVVIGGCLLLFAWLWMRIPRFGPVLQDNAIKRQPYGKALITSARYLWRSGQLEYLLRPLRARLEKENQGDPETLCDRLAEESGLTRDDVAVALTTDPPKDPGHLVKVAQKLQALLKR